MNDPHWTTYLSALLTPTIALLGGFIAYRQWKTAQNKLKMELFERRLAVYDAVTEYLSLLTGSGRTSLEAEYKFLSGIRGAKWLFDFHISFYLENTFRDQVNRLAVAQAELDGRPVGDERRHIVETIRSTREWLESQREFIDVLFEPYLALTHK
jgi:hypothetical protein